MQTILHDQLIATQGSLAGENQPDKEPETSVLLKVNPFMRIQFGPPIICDLLLDGRSVELPDSAYIELIAQLDQNVERSLLIQMIEKIFEVSTSEAEVIIVDLEKTGVFVGADEKRAEMEGVHHWIRRGWLDALILHLKSRDIDCADDDAQDSRGHNGEMLRKLIEQEDLPELWRRYPNSQMFELPLAESLPEGQTFEDVLLRRRSFEPWAQKQLKLSQLSTILSFANKENLRLRNAVAQCG